MGSWPCISKVCRPNPAPKHIWKCHKNINKFISLWKMRKVRVSSLWKFETDIQAAFPSIKKRLPGVIWQVSGRKIYFLLTNNKIVFFVEVLLVVRLFFGVNDNIKMVVAGHDQGGYEEEDVPENGYVEREGNYRHFRP